MNGRRAKAIRRMLEYDTDGWRSSSLEEKYNVQVHHDRSKKFGRVVGTLFCRGLRGHYQTFKRNLKRRKWNG